VHIFISKGVSKQLFLLIRYITKGQASANQMYMCEAARQTQELAIHQSLDSVSVLLTSIDRAVTITEPADLCAVITEYKLTWEQCPSQLLKVSLNQT